MSWHCPICESSDNKMKWAKVMVASIHGGIPITFVCHIKCLRCAVCNVSIVEDTLKGGCESLDEDFDTLDERHAE